MLVGYSTVGYWERLKNQEGTCLLMHGTSLVHSPIALLERLSAYLPWLKWVSSEIAACPDLSELQKTMICLERGEIMKYWD